MVRDFFWDDDFRSKWDSMLAYFKILEEFPESGTTVVHWVKKVPGRSLISVVKLEKPSKIIKADWNLYFLLSSLSSAVTGNISLADAYGSTERLTTV